MLQRSKAERQIDVLTKPGLACNEKKLTLR